MDRTGKKIMESIRRRDPLGEPLIKLSSILKAGGVGAEGYLGMCGDRIADAELIDGEDVRIDFMNFPNMDLTAAGVRICREILKCYVSEDIVADAHEALRLEKSERSHINLISQTLRQMNLWGLARAFVELDARIRRFVAAEICQRFILVTCFRKMRSVYYNILVQVKYHGMLSNIGRIAADVAANSGITGA